MHITHELHHGVCRIIISIRRSGITRMHFRVRTAFAVVVTLESSAGKKIQLTDRCHGAFAILHHTHAMALRPDPGFLCCHKIVEVIMRVPGRVSVRVGPHINASVQLCRRTHRIGGRRNSRIRVVGSEDGLISRQRIDHHGRQRCESMCHRYADRAHRVGAHDSLRLPVRNAGGNRRRDEFLLDDERPAFVIDRVMRKVVGILVLAGSMTHFTGTL